MNLLLSLAELQLIAKLTYKSNDEASAKLFKKASTAILILMRDKKGDASCATTH